MGVFPRGKSWYVKFRVDGKSIVKTAGKRTKAQAHVYEKELRKKHAKRAHGAAVEGLFTHVLAEHINVGDGYDVSGKNLIKDPGQAYAIAASTWKRYRCSLGQVKHVIVTFNETRLTLGDIDIDWVRSYIRRRKAASSVSNMTLRRDLDALSNIFELLKAEGEIDANPVREIEVDRLLPIQSHLVVMPTVAEIQSIIDSMHAMLGRFVAFQALTGLRQGEALNLRHADLDMINRTIFVHKGSKADKGTKTRISRTVVMFDFVYELLSALPKPPDHEQRQDGGYVFWHLDDDGNPTNYKRFASQWRSFREWANLDRDIRDHDLRHFYAWYYMRRGGRVEGLQTQMGHLTRKMTEFYAQLQADIARRDLEMMGEAVGTKADTGITAFRFNFDKCGAFGSPREMQWMTRRKRDEIRAAAPAKAAE
jgi:integrase